MKVVKTSNLIKTKSYGNNKFCEKSQFAALCSKSENVEMQLFFDFESFFGQSKLDIFFVLFSLAEKTFKVRKCMFWTFPDLELNALKFVLFLKNGLIINDELINYYLNCNTLN